MTKYPLGKLQPEAVGILELSGLPKRLVWLLVAALVASVCYGPARACDANTPCDKCARESEMSWNPENKFVSDRLNRFYALEDLVRSAYEANDLTSATGLAKEYLDLAGTYRCNWNYGNAIHDANSFLGLVSLKNADRDSAVAYLLKAGKSTGSPQLNTFGPDLDLANALLKQGQVEPVKAYLRDIKVFWEMDNGQVAKWLTSIEKGEKPELNRFSKAPSTEQLLLFWVAIAWPALAAGASLYFLKRRISRKWLFGITSLVSGYLAMMIMGVGISFLMPKIIESVAGMHPSLVLPVLYTAMAATFVFSLLAILGVSRFFLARKEAS